MSKRLIRRTPQRGVPLPLPGDTQASCSHGHGDHVPISEDLKIAAGPFWLALKLWWPFGIKGGRPR